MDRNLSAFRTEFEFTLPRGYVDGNGVVHKSGVMRLATAADEILPLRDPRVQANPAYLTVIILARVTKLNGVAQIDTQVVESLFASDLEYLRRLYEDINSAEEPDGAEAPGFGNGRALGGLKTMGEA